VWKPCLPFILLVVLQVSPAGCTIKVTHQDLVPQYILKLSHQAAHLTGGGVWCLQLPYFLSTKRYKKNKFHAVKNYSQFKGVRSMKMLILRDKSKTHINGLVATYTTDVTIFHLKSSYQRDLISQNSVINLRAVFHSLPEPNRAWLLVVYVFTPGVIIIIIYVTWYTRHLPESDCGCFGRCRLVYRVVFDDNVGLPVTWLPCLHTKHLPDTPC